MNWKEKTLLGIEFIIGFIGGIIIKLLTNNGQIGALWLLLVVIISSIINPDLMYKLRENK